MSNPWFRMYAESVDDDKLRLLAFEDRWHFIAILCCKCQGLLDIHPETLDRRVAVKLGLQFRDTDEVKRRLMELDLIDEKWQPVAWNKRQFVSDHDPTNTERQRRYRDKKKQGNQTGNNGNGHVTRDITEQSRVTVTKITLTDTDTDTDTEKEKKEKKTSSSSCSEPASPSAEPYAAPAEVAPRIVIAIPLVSRDGEFAVTEEYAAELRETYPGVDVLAQLRRLRRWCLDNPTRRKTAKGVRRFISGWMAREQDRGRVVKAPTATTTPSRPAGFSFPQRTPQ